MFCACGLFAGGSSPSLKGKSHLRYPGGGLTVRPTFRSGTSASVTSCIVQWLCHRFTVAQAILRHGVNHLFAVRGM